MTDIDFVVCKSEQVLGIKNSFDCVELFSAFFDVYTFVWIMFNYICIKVGNWIASRTTDILSTLVCMEPGMCLPCIVQVMW
jgi:hypothetical protein